MYLCQLKGCEITKFCFPIVAIEVSMQEVFKKGTYKNKVLGLKKYKHSVFEANGIVALLLRNRSFNCCYCSMNFPDQPCYSMLFYSTQ